MKNLRPWLLPVLLCAFAGVASAQGGPPGGFPACDTSEGGLTFDEISDTAVVATLDGDVEGTANLTVDNSFEFSFGDFSISILMVSGTIETAGGNLEVSGFVRSLEGTLPNGTALALTHMSLYVTGGDGDFADVMFGFFSGVNAMGPMGMTHEGYHLVLCTPNP